ncbi:endospore germination permease [Paenibacillus lycopersici]|uniref:Endospore germination permease n=1 Tax=Paenibacillus lycopersici TaxID=2704462 RepID=A0A6C0G1C4_9BACL|nr:endospore germination permease [Paenibacillus lycopersici]QHT61019.1 endospore germination permease [Paenibacillus lycopersici]
MKVSGYQLFWLVNISSMIVFSYLPLQLAAKESRQDCWISILLGALIMMAITWLMLRVCKQHADKTLVGFAKMLLGTVIGKCIVMGYFLLWFIQMSMIAKGMAEFQNLVMLHNTPTIFILLCMLFLVTYAVYRGGIVAIGRCAEVIGPFFVFLLFAQLFLNPQDMDMKRMLPVYADSGWLHILKGTYYSINYLVDPSIVLMLYYFAENKRSAARGIMWGTAVAMAWGVIMSLVLLFVTGPNMAAEMIVPVYSLTKFVSILNFIQNIDAFFIPLWLLGAFIKMGVDLFILSYGISEWTGIKNWKLVACLMSAVWLAYLIYSSHDIRMTASLKNVYLIGGFYPFVYVILPILLWLLGSIRQYRRSCSGS